MPLSHLLNKSLYDIVNSDVNLDLFSKMVGSSTPFKKILKDELLWCLSCIEYQIPNEGYDNYFRYDNFYLTCYGNKNKRLLINS
jgi:hypothetical protein